MRNPTCRYFRSAVTRRSRRGVLILVVLSLLALFLMMGIAYVLTTGQFHEMSRARSSARVYLAEPRETLDAGMYQVLRDTNNDRSHIVFHSLLNDLYGNDGFMGNIGAATMTTGTGGLFLNIAVGSVISATDGRAHALSTTRGAYSGCVFTVVDGSEVGRSTRIVGYDGVDTLTVMSWKTRGGRMAIPANLTGARFVVNGRPFNGMGAGYDPATGKCGLFDSPTITNPTALLPNRSTKGSYGPVTRVGGFDKYPLGGMDESYDAPDFQNMFMAFLVPNPSEGDPLRIPIPSFHRPDLYKYWAQVRGTPNPFGSIGNFPPRAIMRPLPRSLTGEIDFPFLPGAESMPQFGTSPWDVDNDGDSVRDSVWVDLGFPNATAPDGFNYRPLFAFLILDLDGRLNLNAHGNITHYNSNYYAPPPTPPAPTIPVTTPPTKPYRLSAATNLTALSGSPASPATIPRGEGIGPAEIHLDAGGGNIYLPPTGNNPVFTGLNPVLTTEEYQALLQGNANWPGRYGLNSDGAPGVAGQYAKYEWLNLFGIPANFFNSGIFTANALGRPINVRGELVSGLAHNGAPIYEASSFADDRVDSPYGIDLSRDATKGWIGQRGDAPFSVNELEWLLRPGDRDTAGLPNRIPELAPSIKNGYDVRRLFTTESRSLPVPYVNVSRATRANTSVTYETSFGTSVQGATRVPSHIADILKQRLTSSGLSVTAANDEIVRLLPPELLRGELFDLNRLLGNGVDDNTNNVVDEPGETSEILAYPTATSSVTVPMDYINGDPTFLKVPNTPLGARQLMARYLYCLAMLVRDNVNIDFDGNAGNNNAAETAKGLAQWAINVVDFRDADSIMTPFEYDPNPFNGWAPDGDLATTGETERGVVWGLERPELLITETIAWHDRATEDRTDDPSMKNTTSPAPADPDFDQRFRPKGAAFIELYNPWAGQDKYPAELYTNNSGTPVLNLNRLSAQGNSPIWRVLVIEGPSQETLPAGANVLAYDPDEVYNAAGDTVGVERSIYFSNNFSGVNDGHGVAYYPSAGSLVSPISPGGYAVVGSAGRPQGSNYVTTIGHLTSDPDGQDANIASTRRVVLSPSTGQVSVLSNAAGTNPSTTATAAAIAIDTPRSFSVSEPDGVAETYYANSVTDPVVTTDVSTYGTVAGEESKYGPKPIDHPLDKARANADSRWAPLMIDGTTRDFRTIHLQRLANPLIAWHKVTNPYITIDCSTMNLTAFNGAEPSGTTDPDVVTASPPTSYSAPSSSFAALQRGRSEAPDIPSSNVNARTLWRHEFSQTMPVAGPADSTHIKGHSLKHSLGYINEQYGSYGATYPDDTAATGYTFPWLTWNNRPFISPMELMIVPRSKPSRLAFDYTALPKVQATAPVSPVFRLTSTTRLVEGYQSEVGIYGHLLNFFDARANGMHLYRLLDYVGVPSPYAGTREMLNPDPTLTESFGKTTTPAGFRAPLNTISWFRDPGKVNINTINDARIWQAIVGTHPGPTWNQFVTSRRGYGAENNTMFFANTGLPTFFANPFRGSGTGELVPWAGMERADIDVTLLRSYPDAPAGTTLHAAGSAPFLQPQYSYKYNQADRNPYFRNLQARRIGNMVTTQSNVYAVWVTMAYFGVFPANTAEPTLWKELGVEVNGGTRHRAFYIIDRSIPVAFEPGENHNVDDAILIRRMLD